jgi:hypothetical protein
MNGHDRHFRRIELDEDVVDADRGQRRQQMLDGLDRHFVARKARGQLDTRQIVHGGGHFVIAEVRTAEADAEIGRSRLEREIDFVAGMKADSHAGNLAT